jgi:hypothetical protein
LLYQLKRCPSEPAPNSFGHVPTRRTC